MKIKLLASSALVMVAFGLSNLSLSAEEDYGRPKECTTTPYSNHTPTAYYDILDAENDKQKLDITPSLYNTQKIFVGDVKNQHTVGKFSIQTSIVSLSWRDDNSINDLYHIVQSGRFSPIPNEILYITNIEVGAASCHKKLDLIDSNPKTKISSVKYNNEIGLGFNVGLTAGVSGTSPTASVNTGFSVSAKHSREISISDIEIESLTGMNEEVIWTYTPRNNSSFQKGKSNIDYFNQWVWIVKHDLNDSSLRQFSFNHNTTVACCSRRFPQSKFYPHKYQLPGEDIVVTPVGRILDNIEIKVLGNQ